MMRTHGLKTRGFLDQVGEGGGQNPAGVVRDNPSSPNPWNNIWEEYKEKKGKKQSCVCNREQKKTQHASKRQRVTHTCFYWSIQTQTVCGEGSNLFKRGSQFTRYLKQKPLHLFPHFFTFVALFRPFSPDSVFILVVV